MDGEDKRLLRKGKFMKFRSMDTATWQVCFLEVWRRGQEPLDHDGPDFPSDLLDQRPKGELVAN